MILGGLFFSFLGYLKFQQHAFAKAYDAWEYTILADIIPKNTPESLHNTGNVFYKKYETSQDIQDIEQSVSYYSGSLSLQEHPDTRYNYELALKKLQELSSKKEETSEEETQQPEEEQQEEWTQDSSSESTKWDNQDTHTLQNTRSEQYQMNGEEQIDELTQDEAQFLEDAQSELKQQQRNHQQFFNANEQQSPIDDMFESFFWRNPMFENGRTTNEKDW